GRVLLFTGETGGCGTTSVVLNLAVTAARRPGGRVAVVDGNLRQPAIADRLGIAATPGLRDVLARTLPLAHALQPAGPETLRPLPAGQPGADPWLPLDGLRGALRQLRAPFDLVFVDSQAWSTARETALLAPHCDAACLVRNDGSTSRPAIPNL